MVCSGRNTWQAKLGLIDWNITCHHEELESALASTNANNENSQAGIALNTRWPAFNVPTRELIEQVALHEVLHVLLADLSYLGTCRYVSRAELDTAEHRIVRRLEHVLGGVSA